MNYINDKHKTLCEFISRYDNVIVAFSGGVDSTLLLNVASSVLGDKVVAITASLPAVPRVELNFCKSYCADNHINWTTVDTNDISKIPYFTSNTTDRCYHCKKRIFEQIISTGIDSYGFSNVMEGSNIDDLGDYRPGLIALKELNVISPFIACGLTKSDIRELSHQLKLPTSNKPSSPCLATRIPYGEEITSEKLERIEKAEEMLLQLDINNCRVRYENHTARIEVSPSDFDLLLSNREKIIQYFHKIGFTYVSLDLDGFRSGSLNQTLTDDERKIIL